MKLSAVMIVRNEVENIDRCLNSIKGVCDEVIIFDTGSTDGTIEAIHEHGIKPVVLDAEPLDGFFIETEGGRQLNFSMARNYAGSLAKGDWLFVIDADEELVCEKKLDIKKCLGMVPEKYPTCAIPVIDIHTGKVNNFFNSKRFFRREAYGYKGIVHNKPIDENETALLPDIRLNHYGYDLSAEKKEAKKDRTFGLLKYQMEQEPDNYALMYYMAQTHAWHDNDSEALSWAEKYYQAAGDRKDDSYNRSIYFMAYCAAQRLKDEKAARAWLDRGLQDDPQNLDMLYSLCGFGVWLDRLDLMANGATSFIRAYKNFNPGKTSGQMVHTFAPECLAYCYGQLAVAQLKTAQDTLNTAMNAAMAVPNSNYREDLVNGLIRRSAAVVSRAQNGGGKAESPEAKKTIKLKRKPGKKYLCLIDPLSNKFALPTAKAFKQAGYFVQIIQGSDIWQLKDACEWSDVILSLWSNEPLKWLSQEPRKPEIITYLRSYEALTPGLIGGIKWGNVSGAVFVAEHIRKFAMGQADISIPTTVINNFVELSNYPKQRHGHGTNIAYLGYLNHKKGIELLLQCLSYAANGVDSNYKLHVGGTFQEQRVETYFHHAVHAMGLSENVVMHGWVEDIPKFLSDKNYVVSTSPWEGCPNNIIEAMACGVKPLVHNWPGAVELFGKENVWETITEFTRQLFVGDYDTVGYRDLVKQKFNADKQLAALVAFVESVRTKKEQVAA